MQDHDTAAERLALRRISPALGAELTGFDAETLASPSLGAFLRQALLEHQLVLLRGVDLDPASFRRLGVNLGPLRRVPDGMQIEPGMPDVQRLTNLGADGAPTGVLPDPYSLHWHTDGSAQPKPSRYSLLYALRVPDHGSDTSFADMYAACAALPAARRQALVGRLAIHDPQVARHFRHGFPIVSGGAGLLFNLRMRLRFVGRMLSREIARHPVIRVHEETGRACLYLGDHAWRVTGCWWPAGARLVNELNAFATSHPEWIYTHSWQVGDLVIWDNRCLLHRASRFDTAGQKRVMLRAVVESVSVPTAARA
jgi:taurine dioxygenase